MSTTNTHADSGTASGSTAPAPRPWRRRRVALVAASGLAAVAVAAALVLEDDGRTGTEGAPAPAPSDAADDQSDDAAAEAGAAAADELSWAPPTLVDPEVVQITEDEHQLELDPDTDYELELPDEPLEVTGGVTITGGRNVVLVGGEISIPDTGEDEGHGLRALLLRDQTGTVHIEGLKLTGEGLGEGVNLDQRQGATVQLQNIWVGEVFGSPEGHHGDLVQSWAGPEVLRVDGLTGSTGYQGFFLLPNQFGDQPDPELFDLRRVDITGAEDGSGYMLWRDDEDWPVDTTDVWVAPTDADPDDRDAFLWDREGEDSWADVEVGTPPDGSFVPEDSVGVGYESPGYGGDG